MNLLLQFKSCGTYTGTIAACATVCVLFLCTHMNLFDIVEKVCYARILDSKRKFLEAALRYYELSQLEKREIGGRCVLFLFTMEDRVKAVCDILSASGFFFWSLVYGRWRWESYKV